LTILTPVNLVSTN